jgi:hypothetical protein
MSASTVCGVGSTMSRTRLCVRISNCSRDLLVDVGRAVDGEFLDTRRQRDRATNLAPVRLAVFTISSRHVERAVVEGFQPDADVLSVHRVHRNKTRDAQPGKLSPAVVVRDEFCLFEPDATFGNATASALERGF